MYNGQSRCRHYSKMILFRRLFEMPMEAKELNSVAHSPSPEDRELNLDLLAPAPVPGHPCASTAACPHRWRPAPMMKPLQW
jgi:hypothetical protein